MAWEKRRPAGLQNLRVAGRGPYPLPCDRQPEGNARMTSAPVPRRRRTDSPTDPPDGPKGHDHPCAICGGWPKAHEPGGDCSAHPYVQMADVVAITPEAAMAPSVRLEAVARYTRGRRRDLDRDRVDLAPPSDLSVADEIAIERAAVLLATSPEARMRLRVALAARRRP